MVAAVDITESLLVAGGELGGGDLGFDDADVATAKATAAVDVLLLNHRYKWEYETFDDKLSVSLCYDQYILPKVFC